MGAISPGARDHRRRVLEHQEAMRVKQAGSGVQPADPQLKIPLIGEVRRDAEPPSKKPRRRRSQGSAQPQLDGT